MQGLFGRFGKKKPAQPTIDLASLRQKRQAQSELDNTRNSPPQNWRNSMQEEREFPSVSSFDDDEETNWDDVETFTNENNPIASRTDRQTIYAQPTAPVVAPAPPPVLDLDEWDEALPAATVKSSNIQEARRGKSAKPVPLSDDIWDDDLTIAPGDRSSELKVPASSTFNPNAPSGGARSSQSLQSYLSGSWKGTLNQFRQLLPASVRQFSNAILIGILVAIVTVGIWVVDGFFVPGRDRSIAETPPTSIVDRPSAPTVGAVPKVSPEQAFFEAIQTQLNDVTSEYPDDIIAMLNVDIGRDRAIVQLSPNWYTLTDEQQNTLTDRMWLQARSNHFSKLEIKDTQGVAIARSPVVGKHPIILQRRVSN
jgi:hypothetical protein